MNRTAWILFVALSIVWGLPYFFVKIALVDLPPAWIAFSRVALGAVMLTGVVPRAQWALLRPHAAAIAAVALTDIALPFYLIANGERTVSSSLTGIVLSAIPITVSLLALCVGPPERLTRRQFSGLAIGLAGVAALLGLSVGGTALGGLLMIAGATVSYSVGVLMIKRWLNDTPRLATTAAMLGAAAVVLAPPALLAAPLHRPGVAALAAVGVLGVVCTAAAYPMYFALINRAGAIRATVVTYLNPAVAAVLGIALLHEPVSAAAVAGLLLVVVGSWLSTGDPPSPDRAPRVRAASVAVQRLFPPISGLLYKIRKHIAPRNDEIKRQAQKAGSYRCG